MTLSSSRQRQRPVVTLSRMICIAYRHAVYADKFMALASTNTQLNLMFDLSDPELTSDESESVMSDEVDDGSVAEVAEK